MNDGEMGKRKRGYQLNYRDWGYKARFKKAHGLRVRGDFPLDLWIDYVIKCADYYKALYALDYNRGYIEIGKKGGDACVMAREADRRL